MIHYKPYPAYKDSGVEWLGQVPEHWELRKLKHLAVFAGGGTPDKGNLDYWDGEIPWVSPKDMKREVISESIDHITPLGLASSTTSLIDSGAVLLVFRSGIIRHTVPVGINTVPVALNQDMKAAKLDHRHITSKFLLRWIQGLNSSLRLAWCKQGATVESLDHEYVASTTLPLPTLPEQHAIEVFLDREAARIDALIEKKQRLIELLKEKRQAVISQAVTGKTPDKAKLGFFIDILPGYAFASEEFSDNEDDVRLLRGVNVGVGSVRWLETVRWDRNRIAEVQEYALKPGDIVFGLDRPWISEGARVAVISDSDVPALLLQRVARIRTKRGLVSGYLRLILESAEFFGHFEPELTGISVPHISTVQIASYKAFIPEIPEQERLVREAGRRMRAISRLSRSAQESIELLQEHRSALITAAVTGQIDLRNAV